MGGSIVVAGDIPALPLPAYASWRSCYSNGGYVCFSPSHVGWLSRIQYSFREVGARKGYKASFILSSYVKVGAGNGASRKPSTSRGRPLSSAQLSEIAFTVMEAASKEELRAAAYLRARTFYTYPEERSVKAVLAHRHMKAEDDWQALVSKVTGVDESYGRVICLIALAKVCSPDLIVPSELRTFCKVGLDMIVVGSLDLSQGLLLPGEITGDRPCRVQIESTIDGKEALVQGPEAESRRGYLSNVCVAEEVRRMGVAKALIAHAKNAAQQWGITNLYVHVVFDNFSAQNLYWKAGFEYEKEENSACARWESRPRRFLLHTSIPEKGTKTSMWHSFR